ncbi:protein-L-isoaspartate O-methyltransferase [Kitasatospora sp. NPDC098652]|uniref:protein-L-isoaspartate O-methyltransferase n=1 Tax=Kitasatospora sp. NPDC098652 TaxID=3364095 RepID=UPI00380E3725
MGGALSGGIQRSLVSIGNIGERLPGILVTCSLLVGEFIRWRECRWESTAEDRAGTARVRPVGAAAAGTPASRTPRRTTDSGTPRPRICPSRRSHTGTGWTAGLLSRQVGAENVTSVELDPDLARRARHRLHAAGLRSTVIAGDGTLGHPEGAPFDRVHFTAAVQRLPSAIIDQTAPGGVILVPYGTPFCNGALLRLTVAEDGQSASGPFVEDVSFMWVRDQRPDSGEFDIGDIRRGASGIDPAAVAEQTHAAFAIGLRMPDLFRQDVWAGYDRFGTGRAEVWDGTSYAHCRFADWAGPHAVSQSGPRSLWDEVTAAHGWWVGHGKPDLTRLGMTVTVSGEHHPWLDEPGNVLH